MSRYIDAEWLIKESMPLSFSVQKWVNEVQIMTAPSIEPNRILPERMERGDIYEVGETIVVMNHDDYYDLLCKSWEPKRGEWIGTRIGHYPGYECSLCHYGVQPWNTTRYCPNCGAKMKGADDEA